MVIKLSGGSGYGASLLWVTLFGSSQPCVWLKRKIEAQQNFKHKLLPQIFRESLQILQAFWLPKTICHKVVFVDICLCLPRFSGGFFAIAIKRNRNEFMVSQYARVA